MVTPSALKTAVQGKSPPDGKSNPKNVTETAGGRYGGNSPLATKERDSKPSPEGGNGDAVETGIL